MNAIAEIKQQRYISALYCYGIIPLTLLLQEYEKEENFEECNIILEAIKFVNKYTEPHMEEQLPTKYSRDLIDKMKSEFNKFGFKGDVALGNTEYYIREIKKKLKI